MKRLMVFGCLAGALACAACERIAHSEVSQKEEETVVRQGDVVFSLDEVARLFAALPVGEAQVAEVRDAVSASAGNGYDEEYTLQNLFEAPGSGIGSAPATRVEGYPEPLRDLLAAEVRRQYATRAVDPEAFLDALSESDVQLYWPFSEDFTTDEAPIVTFNPGDNASRNIGYIRREDGTIEEIVVDEEMARERPVWVVNRNIDAEYQTLEMRRREDPDWGQGGSILIRSGEGPDTRASGKDFKTLVLRQLARRRFGGLGQVRSYRRFHRLNGSGTAALHPFHHGFSDRGAPEGCRQRVDIQRGPRIGMDRDAGQLRFHDGGGRWRHPDLLEMFRDGQIQLPELRFRN